MIIAGGLAAVCFVISCFQFAQKGFLFNNAYIYASGKARKTMNKKPYYVQSGVVFLLLGFVFLISIVNMILKAKWLSALLLVFIAMTVLYAVISTIVIEVKQRGKTL